jgi:pyruvate dehydrogenase E2 component (dihydrolipoamide acetyltransferase)
VLASPVVRKIAREQDIDLKGVQGSGPGGRIIKRDVEGKQAQTQTVAAPAGLRAPRVVPISPMRKVVARRMTEAKQTVPHFYLTVDVDADAIWKARQEINASLEKTGEKVSINDILIKACAIALRRVPEVNASYRGDSLHYHERVDISVAVAVPEGLMVPVVRDADLKGILEISQEVRELAGRAKEKKLKPEEMTDGTFSISNLGMYGIDEFSAVINPPEGAILAVGAVREEPVLKDGQIVAGRRMKMTLSCDHRVIDGATGARWLQALRPLVEQPLAMLLWSSSGSVRAPTSAGSVKAPDR